LSSACIKACLKPLSGFRDGGEVKKGGKKIGKKWMGWIRREGIGEQE